MPMASGLKREKPRRFSRASERAGMVRLIAAAALGSLVAGGALYAASEPAWLNTFAGWLSRLPEPKIATEGWPICTTMTVMGAEVDWAQLDPDFADGKRALVAEDWNSAIVALKLAALRDPRNADIQNYIGYAYRRLRQLGPAMGHYQQALMFNPRHRSAHEHLGELFLVLGEPVKAEAQLAVLKEICLIPCDELADLQRAIAAYKAAATQRTKPASVI
jgi:tetratricopeptide (TPR) repeat protein